MNVNRKISIAAVLLCVAAASAQAWGDKGPSFKEKVTALAAAGKTIPVVYLATELEAAAVTPPSIMENALFKAPAPAEFAALGDEAVKALNESFGVTAFKAVAADKVPTKESKVWGKVPDWAAADFEVYVAVREYAKYVASTAGKKSLKLALRGEVELMENVLDKKGVKESKSIKTLRASAYSKAAPVDRVPAKPEDCAAAVPAGSVQPELVKKVQEEIADFAKKK
ncbi:MAG: hypothetical protein A2506_10375 [Elusimicrobia bacterium RIFOXYD12_FULL_66_9]|nr:MAG: hypothetical protein A2506_10375 [Elusimicrobia bacterium RIFOXYD12_FULL_66_9]